MKADLKNFLQEAVWTRLQELGLTNTVIDFVDGVYDKNAEEGYKEYQCENVYDAIAEGMEKAGLERDTTFKDQDVLAVAYLMGLLLGNHVVKNQE